MRASISDENGNVESIDYISEYFGCGSAAFPPENRKLVEERLNWSDIGIGHTVVRHAYEDGYYASKDQFQYNGKEPIGVNLVFEHIQPVVEGTQWLLSPDLVVALRLIEEGTNCVRPEEDFVAEAREKFDDKGEHRLIEIKRESLIDYLAPRNLSLRISYYRRRVENVPSRNGSNYAELTDIQDYRDGGRFELQVCDINHVFGGSLAMLRAWGQRRTTTPAMKAPKADVVVMKVFGLSASSGGMNGLNTNLRACEFAEMQTLTSLSLLSRLTANAWYRPNWTTRILVDGFGFGQRLSQNF